MLAEQTKEVKPPRSPLEIAANFARTLAEARKLLAAIREANKQ